MICGMKKRTSLDCLNQQLLIGLSIFLIQPFSEMKDILSVQRHVRVRGEIIILNGNEMYSVPIVTVLKTFQWWTFALRSRYGQLRHGMDIAVMFCSYANSEYTSCIQSFTNIKKTLVFSCAYSKSGNN